MAINIVNRLGSNTINGRTVSTVRNALTALDKYVSIGKYYHEIKIVSFTSSRYNHANFGFISSSNVSFEGYKGIANTDSYSTFQEGTNSIKNFGTGLKPNDVLGLLLDANNKKYRIYINGVFIEERDIVLNDYSPMLGSWNTDSLMTVSFNIAKADLLYIPSDVDYVIKSYEEEILTFTNKILLLSGHKTYSLRKNEKKYEAKMTSNTAPTPFVASASSENGVYLAWKAFNGSLATSEDAWATLTNVTNAYLQIDFGKQISIDGFAVGSRYYAVSSLHQYAPKDFNLLASNDGVVFDKVAEITGQSDWGSAEIRKFIAYTGKKYRYYRLQVLSVNGGNLINVGSLEFFSSEITQIPIANEQNFINHGFDTLEGLKRVYSVKNYILQDGVSEDANGLWVQELNRKPLSIKIE